MRANRLTSPIAALAVVVSITLAPVAAAHADTPSLPRISTVGPESSTAAVVPLIESWRVYETNMKSLATCQALMNKLEPAYGPTRHWTCQPYYTGDVKKYQLWYRDDNL